MNTVIMAEFGKNTVFCIDSNNKGLTRVASSVSRDFQNITGSPHYEMRVVSAESPDSGSCANAQTIITAGIIGSGGYIDEIIKKKEVDVESIKNKRECYKIFLKDYDGKSLIIIAGSDLLGAEYGLLKLSSISGVTPWHYWADVKPKKSKQIKIAKKELEIENSEPAIKLRGFFLNDEFPSLGNWVLNTFGGFNEKFYEKVFDLLLRLRGNFMWPAMWTGVFSEDGYAFPHASAELAAELGITMGTSHHEPLFRSGEEFLHLKTDSNDKGYGKDWNYFTNPRGLYEFWTDSVKRNKNYTSLITIGMRGERDSMVLGEHSTLSDNIKLLKDTITDQKKILKDNGLAKAQKVLALYKEVEDYYYGDDKNEGLHNWKELDDVMLLLSDDNYGNTRTLPTAKTRNRKAGYGLYYHFDYHGGPISYEWVNSTPIVKAWEQLTKAYEYGVKDLWVVNVGDLRPVEFPLSYFMDLAFDYETYKEINKVTEYTEKWVNNNFGSYCDEKTCTEIAQIISEYTSMNGDIRPEALQENSLSFSEEHEAQNEIKRAEMIITMTEMVSKKIPPEAKDCFFALVRFPALASANLRKMVISAGLQKLYAKRKVNYAFELAAKVEQCIETDKMLHQIYNEQMAEGKWKYMMSSKHVSFKKWNDEGSDYPKGKKITLPQKPSLVLSVQGSDKTYSTGSCVLPLFTNTENSSYVVTVMNSGLEELNFEIVISDQWIKIEKKQLGKDTFEIRVLINWKKLKKDSSGTIVFISESQKVTVHVNARVFDCSGILKGTFVETTEKVSMLASSYFSKQGKNGVDWVVIDNYGKAAFEDRGNHASIKCLPSGMSFPSGKDSPCVEYRFYVNNPGKYTITSVLAPVNNHEKNKGLDFGLCLNDGKIAVINSLPPHYAAGDHNDVNWCLSVLENGRRINHEVNLEKGLNSLKFYLIDADIVLQKIEIAKKPSKAFYGLPETCIIT